MRWNSLAEIVANQGVPQVLLVDASRGSTLRQATETVSAEFSLMNLDLLSPPVSRCLVRYRTSGRTCPESGIGEVSRTHDGLAGDGPTSSLGPGCDRMLQPWADRKHTTSRS